ncbi:unnamed protein product, partial [Brassica rapa]
KVTPQECRGVPHHLLGVFDSEAGNLTATDFCRLASQEISTLSANNKLPIVAGGSNSYIEALANHSSGFLLNKYQCCFIWVDVSLPVLNSFVSKRVDRMMEAGLLEEVRELHDPKADYSVGIRRAIGVPELHEYLCYESLVDRGTQRKMLDAAVKKIKENTEILACRQLLKIQRLSKKWKLSMHRVDATEVFLKRTEEEADEAWENLVARQTKRIVDKFCDNQVMKNDDVEHCLTSIGAASYGGGSGNKLSEPILRMLKPLVFGDYPDAMKRVLGPRLPVFSEGESEQVKGSSDFLGIIHYTTVYVRNSTSTTPSLLPRRQDFFTDMGAETISSDDTLKPHKAKQRGYRSARLSQKTMCKALSCDSHSKSQSIITPRANMVMPVYCGGDDGGPLKLVLTTPICHNSSSSLCRAWDFKLCRSLFKLIKTM